MALYTPEYQPTGEEIAVINTSKGPIRVQLAGNDAPIHVGNFVELAQKGFYDGLKFHRYVPGFVIQGGCPNTREATPEQVAAGRAPGMAPFGEMTPDIWAYGIQNELDLVYNVCNCAWPYLIEAGGGSIIITSSTVGLQGSNSPQACHAAAKGACLALARQLAAEGGPFGIRCNSITPGLVWTEAMSNIPKEMAQGLIAAQTTQQAIDPLDIAYAYLFLASDESRFITAVNLPVDGGCAGAVTGGMQGEIA